MKNTDLKHRYNLMHKTGKSAWFDSGTKEREGILYMGQPWEGKTVLEIGCGEGDLLDMVHRAGAQVVGVDYSETAIDKCKGKFPHLDVYPVGADNFHGKFDVVLMQGVLEHLDDPFVELGSIIDWYIPKTVITSMPGFLNTRGIIWHTLDMLGAVMSKTDLHFIDPWQVEHFCIDHGYDITYRSIEIDWGNGQKMLEDFRKRIPLALKDGNIICEQGKLDQWFVWLEYKAIHTTPNHHTGGAVNIYRIDL